MCGDNLKGKTILVTGSTSGIGKGIAGSFAERGANVVLNGFGDKSEIEALRSSLEKDFGIKAIYSGADMSKPEEIREMCAQAIKTFDKVDILVNNAGIQNVQPIDEFDDGKWNAIIAINLSSAFHTTKHLAPKMKEQKWGRVINIASVHGLFASPYKAGYIAAKHGMIGLTKATALDLATFGITANAICPGYVETPLVKAQIPQQAKENNMSEAEVRDKVFLKNHFIKRFVDVKEIAGMALYLSSDTAQTITGQSMVIDCGWTAH